MFHSAALKLTGWYLAIIMLLSIGCSLALYQVSSSDLSRNARRQTGYFDKILTPLDFNNYEHLREKQLHDDRSHLKANLVLFNLLVLGGGGIISYGLARRTLEPIEDSLEAQKRFTADASHELRTPLTAIQMETEVALRNKSLTKNQARELLASNLEEVAKLKALSEGLLELASEDGKNLQMGPVSLREIINEAVSRHAKQTQARRIKIHQNIKNITVKGDYQSLIELMNLLLDNAIKYSPPGSQISVSTAKRNRGAYITITDHGQGISPQDLPHIFDRFFRAESSRSKDKTNGYGLGLAIAKKITELHHGSIEVKSTLGKGSTFTVQLPAA